MRRLAAGRGIRGWLAVLRPRPVVLSSACPPGECAGRLGQATAQRGLGAWYRDPHNYRRGDPRLVGTVDPYQISVGRYPEAAGRNSFAPWLQGRLEAAADGGTTLSGRIGLHSTVLVFLPVLAAVWTLMALAVVAAGIGMLVTGHIIGLVPAVLSPLAWTALMAGISFISVRSLDHDIPKLINEMCGILDATATFCNPAAMPLADGKT